MLFAVTINEGPYQHQASDSAYLFCRAVLEKGHELRRVFFYNDGVNNASSLTEPPLDDRNIVNRWSKLAADHKVDLVVCVAAALRRGIRDENLAAGFRISGLGQLVEAGIEADRLVTFGD
ncbi:MAG: sulfurtransferase complex subunit TusD [Rhodocyclales bacterium]|jgi:tRNA 2-thiouridine synthesizing protein D|nr:sulfurtransferase complex subunit TusD [Rhodocyclales bacterium]